MNTIDALKNRKSTRAFLNKTVEQEKIDAVLTAASYAPSGVNTQPWQVAVVSGDAKSKLQNKIESAFRGGDMGKADYSYYPDEWVSPYKDRRKECGLLMFSTLGITREDKQRQQDQWAANYRSFDAPVMMLFFLDSVMQTGSYIDYGMFIQSLMIAAVDQGLSTCPQASLADYPHIIKPELGYAEDTVLICGMSMGYEDVSAAVNTYRTPREKPSSFTRYYK
ncbi:UNVERIFIED_CONTAM: hypothetical protein GTU68_063167 [Idotea baltica]|nr:hypothetical protein [Idotea baltica]